MYLRFGPSSPRVVAARTALLIGLSLLGVEDVEGVETVRVKLDETPPENPPRTRRPIRVFAVYSDGPPDIEGGETPQAFLDRSPLFGQADVPAAADDVTEGEFKIPVPGLPENAAERVYHVQTLLGYAD